MSEANEIKELASEFLHVVYEIRMNQNTPIINLHQVAEHMDSQILGLDGPDYVDKLSRVGQYLEQRGLLEGKDGSKQSGPSMFIITREGMDEVEGRSQPQQTSQTNYFYGSVEHSIIGAQERAEITANVNFGNIEQRIETEGGEDKEELYEVLAEIRRVVEQDDQLDRGALTKFSSVMQRRSWITAPIASMLLGFATQSGS